MIIKIRDGKGFDTNIDLTAAERHILQKLFLWESLATSIREFRHRKREAFEKGWNNSGPISESPPMKEIIHHLEEKVTARLEGKGS